MDPVRAHSMTEILQNWATLLAGGIAAMFAWMVKRHISRVDSIAVKVDEHALEMRQTLDQHASEIRKAREDDRRESKQDFRRIHTRLDNIQSAVQDAAKK